MSVIAFPISRQVSTVREVAASIGRLHGEAAVTFWRAKARDLLSAAIDRGHDLDGARREVLQFFDAVQMTLREPLTNAAAQAAPTR